jgi:Tfp pilus assembly protein PilN
MADINPLPAEERANERYYTIVHRLQIASVAILATVAVLTIVTLILFTSASSRHSNLVLELEDLSAAIHNLKPQEELIVVVKDKVGVSQQLVTANIFYNNFFNKLAGIVPSGIYFTDFRVSAGKAVISGKARASGDVGSFVSALTGAKGSELVADVSVDTLSSDETGVFSFVISAKVIGD